jgi:hypothetical protein
MGFLFVVRCVKLQSAEFAGIHHEGLFTKLMKIEKIGASGENALKSCRPKYYSNLSVYKML